MMTTQLAIGPGCEVSLNFEIRLASGEVIDSNFCAAPVSFIVGDGQMLAGFESVMLGLQSGVREVFDISPEQGFGAHNPSNIQRLARNQFAGMELEEGLVVSFQDPSGELPGVVTEFDEQRVLVDFNHPLAGKALQFEVQIHQVTAPS